MSVSSCNDDFRSYCSDIPATIWTYVYQVAPTTDKIDTTTQTTQHVSTLTQSPLPTNSVCTIKHPSTSSTSASLYPVSPPDNTFALPSEVFSSCLAIISAVMVGGLFLWPALRYGTGYQTVWETQPSAETPSDVLWRLFYFQLTCVHSTLELSGRCALQIHLLTYLPRSLNKVMDDCDVINSRSRPKAPPSVAQ